jgi:hypothetical protein
MRGVRCRSFAKLFAPSAPFQLHFEKARMTVHTVGRAPDPGLVILANSSVPTVPAGESP